MDSNKQKLGASRSHRWASSAQRSFRIDIASLLCRSASEKSVLALLAIRFSTGAQRARAHGQPDGARAVQACSRAGVLCSPSHTKTFQTFSSTSPRAPTPQLSVSDSSTSCRPHEWR